MWKLLLYFYKSVILFYFSFISLLSFPSLSLSIVQNLFIVCLLGRYVWKIIAACTVIKIWERFPKENGIYRNFEGNSNEESISEIEALKYIGDVEEEFLNFNKDRYITYSIVWARNRNNQEGLTRLPRIVKLNPGINDKRILSYFFRKARFPSKCLLRANFCILKLSPLRLKISV